MPRVSRLATRFPLALARALAAPRSLLSGQSIRGRRLRGIGGIPLAERELALQIRDLLFRVGDLLLPLGDLLLALGNLLLALDYFTTKLLILSTELLIIPL